MITAFIKKITYVTAFAGFSALSSAATLGIYEFTGTSTADNQFNAVTLQPEGGAFSTFTRTNVTWNAGANYFNSSGWNTTVTLDTAEYTQFSFTVSDGYVATVNSISFFQQGSNTVNDEYRVAYSVDGFSTTAGFVNDAIAVSPGSSETWGFGSVGLTAGQAITFRFYVFGDTQADGAGVPSASGTFRLDAISLDGSIATAAVPEPSAYAAILGVVALAGVATRRRRA